MYPMFNELGFLADKWKMPTYDWVQFWIITDFIAQIDLMFSELTTENLTESFERVTEF